MIILWTLALFPEGQQGYHYYMELAILIVGEGSQKQLLVQ
jgi:hypothetical protein